MDERAEIVLPGDAVACGEDTGDELRIGEPIFVCSKCVEGQPTQAVA